MSLTIKFHQEIRKYSGFEKKITNVICRYIKIEMTDIISLDDLIESLHGHCPAQYRSYGVLFRHGAIPNGYDERYTSVKVDDMILLTPFIIALDQYCHAVEKKQTLSENEKYLLGRFNGYGLCKICKIWIDDCYHCQQTKWNHKRLEKLREFKNLLNSVDF